MEPAICTVMKREKEDDYAEACADNFQEIIKEWKIKGKVTTSGTDGACNMVVALRPFPHILYLFLLP